jgi:glycosyltransferase involved in cell wall biosynthesis
LKIGFLSARDPTDRKSWSGLIFYFYNALKSIADEVEYLRLPPSRELQLATRVVSKMRRVLKVRGDITQSVPLSMVYGKLYRQAILASGCDLVFSPAASTEIGYLRSPVPVMYLSDATFRVMENYYYPLSEVHRITRWEGNHLEKRAIRNSAALIYASDWAAHSAIEHYGANPDKTNIIPFGANMDDVPARASLSEGSTDGRLRLLFVGRDWERKGGQIAFDALLALLDRGIDVELTVIGCTPAGNLAHSSLRLIPHLDKNLPEQRAMLAEFYRTSDIFLLPTRAECSGVVFCEAGAYGLPIVSTQTGGVPTVVVEGVNGLLLPHSADGKAYAETVAALWRDRAAYLKMRHSSRDRYDTTLNWTAWAAKVRPLLERLALIKQSRSQGEQSPKAQPFH